jgi:hypothetical protein
MQSRVYPSYLHEHSGLSHASSRQFEAARALTCGRLRSRPRFCASTRATHGFRVSRQSLRDARARRSQWVRSAVQHSVVTQLLRLTDTSGRPPIGSPPGAPGAQRPRVTSGRPGQRRRCQITSRPAFVPETPNAEARGCVPGRRTPPAAGSSRRDRASGGRAIGVSGTATTLRSSSSRTLAP